MSKPCPVIHFEMPYQDAARMKTFYEKAFGWHHLQFGPEMGNYVVAETGPSDGGRPTAPGVINGGFYPEDPSRPWSHPSVVIAVEDIHAAISEVTAAGGAVHGEPMHVPGVGEYVSFADPEGNNVSMLQPQGTDG